MEPTDQELRDCYFKARGRRVLAAMRAKAERGVMPGCAPLGYKNVAGDGERVIVIDPETAPKVRLLFELAAKRKMSLRKLAIEVEEMVLRSRNGKDLGVSGLWYLLTNPFYCGFVKSGGELLLGKHPALVDAEIFGWVQAGLYRRKKLLDKPAPYAESFPVAAVTIDCSSQA